jgi:hypothetical protein
MWFHKTIPCDECPFRRRGAKVVRLSRVRILDIAGNMIDPEGGTFTCHKAIHGEENDYGKYKPSRNDVHCAGALIFAERHQTQTIKMQIAERLGLYDPSQFCSVKQRRMIFKSVAEMLRTALPGR